MRYRAIPPSPYLAKYIECFWTLESREKTSAASPERILPDGCVEVIFNLADAFKRYHSNHIVEIQPQTLVAGQNPTAYFSQDHEMSEYFTRKKRLSDFYNTNE